VKAALSKEEEEDTGKIKFVRKRDRKREEKAENTIVGSEGK
jgi:hypothetical protein